MEGLSGGNVLDKNPRRQKKRETTVTSRPKTMGGKTSSSGRVKKSFENYNSQRGPTAKARDLTSSGKKKRKRGGYLLRN